MADSQPPNTSLQMRLKAYVEFLAFAWEEFKQSGKYKPMRIIGRVLWFVLSVLGLLVVLQYGFKLASKRAWAIVILSIVIALLLYAIELLRRFHERTVGGLKTAHQTEIKALKGNEKETRFKLFRRYRKKLNTLKNELADIKEPRVFIDYLDGKPSFFVLKSIGRKDYRVFRVRVTNDGGATLYHLKARLKLSNPHTSFENEDLTLKEEGLPVIRQILYRHEQYVLPKPRTSFTLSRGESQFVNVAMQERDNGQWGTVTLCLSHIGVDNHSNIIFPKEPVEFSIVVLGDMSPYSKNFVLFLDENELLQMKEAD